MSARWTNGDPPNEVVERPPGGGVRRYRFVYDNRVLCLEGATPEEMEAQRRENGGELAGSIVVGGVVALDKGYSPLYGPFLRFGAEVPYGAIPLVVKVVGGFWTHESLWLLGAGPPLHVMRAPGESGGWTPPSILAADPGLSMCVYFEGSDRLVVHRRDGTHSVHVGLTPAEVLRVEFPGGAPVAVTKRGAVPITSKDVGPGVG